MGFRHWIKKTAKKAGKEIEKTANQAIDGIDDLVNEAEKSGMSVIDDIKNLANKAKKEVEGAANKAKNEVEDVAKKSIREVEGVANKAKKEIPDLAEKAVKDIVTKAAEDSIKKALESALSVVELLSPNKLGLFFGVELALVVQVAFKVRIVIVYPVSKIAEIRKWAANPPKGRSQIIACFKEFGPQSFSAEIGICGNGWDSEWDGDNKYDKLDAFLKKQGV